MNEPHTHPDTGKEPGQTYPLQARKTARILQGRDVKRPIVYTRIPYQSSGKNGKAIRSRTSARKYISFKESLSGASADKTSHCACTRDEKY